MDAVVKTLQRDFQSEAPAYADLWVSCGGVTFAVHRVVLETHSEFFRAPRQKFAAQGASVERPLVLDCFPGGAGCFKCILDYCYSDDGSVDDQIVPAGRLLECAQAADWLLMPALSQKLRDKTEMLGTQGRMEVIAALAGVEELQLPDDVGAMFCCLLERFCMVDLARLHTHELHALLGNFAGRMHQLIALVLPLLVQRTDQAATVVGIRQLLVQVYKFHVTECKSEERARQAMLQEPEYVHAVLDELANLEPGVLFSRYSVNFTPQVLFCKYVPVFVADARTGAGNASSRVSRRAQQQQQKAFDLLSRQPGVVAHSPELLQAIERTCAVEDVCAFYGRCLVRCKFAEDFNLLKEAAIAYLHTTSSRPGDCVADQSELGAGITKLLKLVARAQPEEQTRVLAAAATQRKGQGVLQRLLAEHWHCLFEADLQLLVQLCKAERDAHTHRLFLDAIQNAAANLQSLQGFLSDHETFVAAGLRAYLDRCAVYYSPVIHVEACNDVGFVLPLRLVLDFRSKSAPPSMPDSEAAESEDCVARALDEFPSALTDVHDGMESLGGTGAAEHVGLYVQICADVLSTEEREQIKHHTIRVTVLGCSLILDPDDVGYRSHALRLSSSGKPPFRATTKAGNPLQRELVGNPRFFRMRDLTEALSGAESDGRLAFSVKVAAAGRRGFSVLSDRGRRRYEATGELAVQGFRERFQAQGLIQIPALPCFTPGCSCKENHASLFWLSLEFRESATQFRDLDLHVRFLSHSHSHSHSGHCGTGDVIAAQDDRNRQFLLDHSLVLLGFHASYNVWKVLLSLDADTDQDYRAALPILLVQDSAYRKCSVLWRRDLRNWLVGGEDLKLRVEFRCKAGEMAQSS